MGRQIIRLHGPGASGASGSGTSPASLHLTFTNGAAQQGVIYQGTLLATGGVQPYTFAIIGGTLPPGLSLSSSTGTIGGTPTTAGSYTFTAQVTDFAATTDSRLCVINVATPAGGSVLLTPTSVVGRAIPSTDVADPVTRLVSFKVGVVANFSLTPTEYGTIHLSRDGGTNWVWVGWYLWTASGQEISFYDVRPSTAATYKVSFTPGTIAGNPAILIPTASLPSGHVLSATFSVSALALPGATNVSSLTIPAGAGGSWPYNKLTPDGSQYFSIPSASYSDATARLDPNAYFIRLTTQDLDAGGTAIGPEQAFAGTNITGGGTQTWGPLDGDYGTNGFSYTRTGNIAKVRFRVYAINRVDQQTGSFSDPLASVLQTSVGGGAGYVDVVVASGGALPPGKVLGSRIDPATLLGGIQQDPGGGGLVIPNGTPGSSLIDDPSFHFATPGVVGPGTGLLPRWQLFTTTGSVEVRNDGGNSGLEYVRLSGPDTQIHTQVNVSAGVKFYLQIAVRSSNNVGPSHAVGIYVDWLDSSGTVLSVGGLTIVGTISGFISSWTDPGASGYVTAPAGAAFAIVRVSTSASEPGWWDVDDILVQAVVNQTAGGTTATTGQSVTGSGTAVYQAYAALASAVYGLDYAEIAGAFGEFVMMTSNSLSATYGASGGGLVFLHLGSDTNSEFIEIVVDDVNGPHFNLHHGGVTYNGINGTIQDNLGVNHTVKAGLIVS